jgi:Tol biopolymer transport system component
MISVKHTKCRGFIVVLGVCCSILLVIYTFHNYLLLEPFDTMSSWSPDGQRITYTCLRRERARDRRPNVHFGPYEGYDQFKLEEICVVDSNGRNRLQLTDNHISDDFPVWSPDGHQIAYVSGSERVEADIYVADVDAWNPINVTHNPASYGIPHWSPSGEYLLFASNGGDGFHQLSILRLRDGEVTQLVTSRQFEYFDYFVWSPDGEVVAFIAGEMQNNEIYTVSILDSKIEPITYGSSADYQQLTWNPNGQYIAYVVDRPRDSYSAYYDSQTCILNMDTYSKTIISKAGGWNLSWSSDGRFLSYTEGRIEKQSLHIWDHVKSVLLVSFDISEVLTLNWAPDSYQLLVNRFDDWNHDGHTEPKLWLLDIETGKLTPLSEWFPWRGQEIQLDFSK